MINYIGRSKGRVKKKIKPNPPSGARILIPAPASTTAAYRMNEPAYTNDSQEHMAIGAIEPLYLRVLPCKMSPGPHHSQIPSERLNRLGLRTSTRETEGAPGSERPCPANLSAHRRAWLGRGVRKAHVPARVVLSPNGREIGSKGHQMMISLSNPDLRILVYPGPDQGRGQ